MKQGTPLRVCVFVGEFPVLSETFVLRQVAGLVRRGHHVTVVTGKWGERDCRHDIYCADRLDRLVRPIRVDGESAGTRLRSLLNFVGNLSLHAQDRRPTAVFARAVLRAEKATLLDLVATGDRHLGSYDVILAHFGQVGMRALRLKQAGRIAGRLAVIFHGKDMSAYALLKQHNRYRDLFRDDTQLLPISQLWRQRLVAWGAEASRVRVLRMGVDLDRLSFLDPRRPLGSPMRVLSVARLTEKKGIRYALEGVMRAPFPVHYTIVGDGPEKAALRSQAANAGPNTTIELVGRKTQQEVFELFQASDVYLHPSVAARDGDMEGVPVAIMEAMAKGLLVVATEHSGIPELIGHGTSGLLVPERNASAITHALQQLQRAALPIEQLRRAARKAVETSFNNEWLDSELDSILRSLAPDPVQEQTSQPWVSRSNHL